MRSPAPPPREPLCLDIEKLVSGGFGLARHQGQVVLVADAAPGDRLEVEVVETHKGWLKARPTRVIEAGPGRREPPCPHARRCGGCSIQHLTYAAQLEAKLAILRESFGRIGKLHLPEPIRVHPSPEWGYRRRARFHLRPGGPGATRLGFLDRSGRGLVDIGPCPVLTPRLEASLASLRRQAVAARRELSVLDADEGVREEGSDAHVTVGGERLEVPPASFFQSNAPLLSTLVERVVELALGGGGSEAAVDLYAGVGLLTLPLARRFPRVVAVEGATRTVRALEANVRSAGLANVEVLPEAVETALARPGAVPLRGTAVVLDPPRAGIPPAVRDALARVPPERLVYVACDPVALARDAAVLVGAGLELKSVDLFDLFPQTHHIEAIALLETRASG